MIIAIFSLLRKWYFFKKMMHVVHPRTEWMLNEAMQVQTDYIRGQESN